jgi:hypothetical protein
MLLGGTSGAFEMRWCSDGRDGCVDIALSGTAYGDDRLPVFVLLLLALVIAGAKSKNATFPRSHDLWPLIPHARNFERARLREFHPLELVLAKAAPHQGDQPGHHWSWQLAVIERTQRPRCSSAYQKKQQKKTQQNREPRSCLREPPDHRETFCGPEKIAGSAHRGFGFIVYYAR